MFTNIPDWRVLESRHVLVWILLTRFMLLFFQVKINIRYRCHNGPVLCLTISGTGEYCYSGGLDGNIHCWHVPNSNIDPYDLFEPEVLNCTLNGHTDAVWGLSVLHSRQHLVSCAADGTVKLWAPHSKVSRYTQKIDKTIFLIISIFFLLHIGCAA